MLRRSVRLLHVPGCQRIVERESEVIREMRTAIRRTYPEGRVRRISSEYGDIGASVSIVIARNLDISRDAPVGNTNSAIAFKRIPHDLAALIPGVLTGVKLGVALTARLLAGLVAGQLMATYVAFVLLRDTSPQSHRILFVAWLAATALGAVAGVLWTRKAN